jgi:hypothetical protein
MFFREYFWSFLRLVKEIRDMPVRLTQYLSMENFYLSENILCEDEIFFVKDIFSFDFLFLKV